MTRKKSSKEVTATVPDGRAARIKELERTVQSIKEQFGEGAIMRLGESKAMSVEVVPTGSFALDIALGVGGVPKGRVVELYGPEASGKTTLALHVIAAAQKLGGLAAFVDVEHALDPSYARRIGVKVDELLLSQPDTGEQALQIVETLVRSGSVDVVVVDSVAALAPEKEIKGEMGDTHIGLQARLMSQALRKLTALVHKTNTIIIFINQVRMKIGVMFGNPETTPGGKALKFYASVRIEVRRIAQIKHQERIVGNRIRAKVVKNKVAPPFQVAEFDIMYNRGISYEGDVLALALQHEVVKKSGNHLSYGETSLGNGVEVSKEFLREHADTLEKIRDDVLAKVRASA